MNKSLFFNILTLVPCFLGLPLVGLEIYESWATGQPLVWTEAFTFLMMVAVLGSIAGIGIFLKLKWARIIALTLFLTGLSIWFVIISIEFSNQQTPTLSLLLLLYGVCICILLLYNEKVQFADRETANFRDILDK